MKYALTYAALVACLLILSGCASNYAARHLSDGSYTMHPNRSEALNVAAASGLTDCNAGECKPITDVPRSKLPESMQHVSNSDIAGDILDSLTVAQGIGQAAGVVNVVSGVGNVTAGLLTIGSIFTGPVDLDDPATKGAIVAWMPKSEANSPEDARAKMYAIVLSALANVEMEGYSLERYSDPEYWTVGINLHGPECNENPYFCAVMGGVSIPNQVKTAPEWLSYSGPSYAWPVWPRGADSSYDDHTITLIPSFKDKSLYDGYHWPQGADARVFLQQVSENLPKWAYIYSPPTPKHPYPVMFNAGEMLLFIEPGNTQVAAQ